MTKTQITEALKELEIEVKAEFVPWSKSRNFDPKKHVYTPTGDGSTSLRVNEGSLNWRVTLVHEGREVITTDYSAGIGHAPSYKNHDPIKHGCVMSLLHAKFLEHEVEKGTECSAGGKPILPDAADVVYSLVQDGDAIDYPEFEQWADNYGYDTDSRKGEQIYRACMAIGLKLRAGIGDEKLRKLRELFEDY